MRGPAGFFERLKNGLARTRAGIVDNWRRILTGAGTVDEEVLEDLEAVLIQADLGVAAAGRVMGRVRERIASEDAGRGGGNQTETVTGYLREELAAILGDARVPLELVPGGLSVVLVVGVNGTGKTTTIGKLAHRFAAEGKKVIMAAADTFRAAASEQLSIWAQRADAGLVAHGEGADPAAVAFDAAQAARARSADVLLVDTAGRLHTRHNLMEELKKIRRVLAREIPGAPHEVLLVVDGTTGQNALRQAEIFTAAVGVTGIVLTKLDGTARGGIVVAIKDALGIPVKFVGVGEAAEDLQEFDPGEFVAALFT